MTDDLLIQNYLRFRSFFLYSLYILNFPMPFSLSLLKNCAYIFLITGNYSRPGKLNLARNCRSVSPDAAAKKLYHESDYNES